MAGAMVKQSRQRKTNQKGETQPVDASQSQDARLNALCNALAAQEPAITELADLAEKQTDVIAGLSLVLRGLIDTLLDEQQRKMLERHLELSLRDGGTRARRSIIDT